MTPKMADALDRIREAGKVGRWLNSYKELGVNAHSVQALVARGLLIEDGKYLVPVTPVDRDPSEADTIGDYKVWPDGYSERVTVSRYSLEDLRIYST